MLDKSGLFQTVRFAPLYKYIAALAAVMLTSYVLSMVLAPLDETIRGMRSMRILGRCAAVGLAAYITYSALGSTTFVLEQGGTSSEVLRSNLGFLLTLAVILFLEIRLAIRGRSSHH